MRELRVHYPLQLLCRTLEVSRRGCHAFVSRRPSKRTQDNARLSVAIKAAHVRTRETYGPERLRDELRDDGFKAGISRIKGLRQQLGIRCKQVRQFKATTNSNHGLPVAANLLNQKFETTRPNEAGVTDITYVRTGEGWLYLAGVKATAAKRPAPGLIHHSDRGSQYCARDYRNLLEQFGMKASMSRRGNCYDNAPMESFWGTLKNERVHHRGYETRAQAIAEITAYIEIFYNRQRRHSRLGNLSPAAFTQQFYRQQQPA